MLAIQKHDVHESSGSEVTSYFLMATLFTSSLVTRTSLHSLRSRGRLGFCIVWTLFTSSLVRPYRLDALRRSVVAMDIVFREEGENGVTL